MPMRLALVAPLALHGDHPSLPPCEHACTHRYEACVKASAVSGKTLLDCINEYYDCAERCPKADE